MKKKIWHKKLKCCTIFVRYNKNSAHKPIIKNSNNISNNNNIFLENKILLKFLLRMPIMYILKI